MEEQKVEVQLGEQTLSIRTGKWAKLAGGSAVVQLGGTVVLVAASAAKTASPDRDFVPLTVDYRERTYAAGRIPGGFFKREGRPTEKEVLSSRLIDRPVRPLFNKAFPYETQIMATVVSSDQENDADVLALVGASTAHVPLRHPVPRAHRRRARRPRRGELRREPHHRPARRERHGHGGGGHGGQHHHGRGRHARDLRGRPARRRSSSRWGTSARSWPRSASSSPAAARPSGRSSTPPDTTGAARRARAGLPRAPRPGDPHPRQGDPPGGGGPHHARRRSPPSRSASPRRSCTSAASSTTSSATSCAQMVLGEGVRADGRGVDEIRKITVEVGVLPRTHGSCLFTRGETQALAVCTLGTKQDEQRIEELEGQSWKSFMLHYNFPPFSVGEVRPIRGPGRREIGHGALAERAHRAGHPGRHVLPVHDPPRERHPRVERLVLDGDGLRRLAGADGRRRADQGAGGRHRHGADQGGRPGRGPHRHPRRRGPPRRHGLQGHRHARRASPPSRWTSRSAASPSRS